MPDRVVGSWRVRHFSAFFLHTGYAILGCQCDLHPSRRFTRRIRCTREEDWPPSAWCSLWRSPRRLPPSRRRRARPTRRHRPPGHPGGPTANRSATVTLITGDRVTVTATGASVRPGAGREHVRFLVRRDRGRLTV